MPTPNLDDLTSAQEVRQSEMDDDVALALLAQELKTIRESQEETAEALKEVVEYVHQNSRNQERIQRLEERQQEIHRHQSSIETKLKVWVGVGGALVLVASLVIKLISIA
jgi:hypothetical protein